MSLIKRHIPLFYQRGVASPTVVIVPLDPPSGLTLTVLNYHTIQADWTDNSSLEEQYELQFKKTSDYSYTTVWLPASTETYTRTGLIGGTNYSFRVRALGPTSPHHSAYTSVVTANTYSYPAPAEMTFASDPSEISMRG